MPKGLKRYYGQDHLHFICCSCYHRQPWLATPWRRDLFSQILEETRQRYGFEWQRRYTGQNQFS